jgi:hypothetical protein
MPEKLGSVEVRQHRNLAKVMACIAAAGMVACHSGGKPAKTNTRSESVAVTPDFSRLTIGGVSCEGGDSRPCFQPLRRRPEFGSGDVSELLNRVVTHKDRQAAIWPFEAYGKFKGDFLKVICQVKGQEVTNVYGDRSAIWDVVEVPVNLVNSAAVSPTANTDIGVKIDSHGQIQAVYAYVPDLWQGNHGIYPQLAPCTSTQNPSDAPSVFQKV